MVALSGHHISAFLTGSQSDKRAHHDFVRLVVGAALGGLGLGFFGGLFSFGFLLGLVAFYFFQEGFVRFA